MLITSKCYRNDLKIPLLLLCWYKYHHWNSLFKYTLKWIYIYIYIADCRIYMQVLKSRWRFLKEQWYFWDTSIACIHHVGDLTWTGLLTRHCFVSWQEVTDLAPGRQRAACQRIRVCSQGGSNYGHSNVWFLCCQKLVALSHLCCTPWKLMRLCCKTL